MDDSPFGVLKASFEYCDIAVSESLKRTLEFPLFANGLLRLCLLNPFCRGATVSRHEACFDIVPVKLPAGIMVDTLQPDIDIVALGDGGKLNDEAINIRD